jgi:hypothetical protein
MDQALILRVDPRLPKVWGQLVGYIESAIRESGCHVDWNEEDVKNMAEAGHVALWALVHDGEYFGACVTQLTYYPRRTVMDVLLVGADAHTEELWFQCLTTLKAIAKSVGCTGMTGTGRPGWFRKLGAERKRIIIDMDV